MKHPDCSGTGTASIDSTVAHSGTRSLKIVGAAGYCNHVFAQAAADLTRLPQTYYVRFYVRHTTALPTSHTTFLAMNDANDGNRDLRMGGQNGRLQWNRSSDDATLPEQSPHGRVAERVAADVILVLRRAAGGERGTHDHAGRRLAPSPASSPTARRRTTSTVSGSARPGRRA